MLRFQLKGSVSLLFYRNQEESGQGGGGGVAVRGVLGLVWSSPPLRSWGWKLYFGGLRVRVGKASVG